ncbi:ROK family protein [Bacteroides faecichinchillae]|uniref:Glucokinase n=1 Tax=Bacteroides faecichinchillae TaxID=871325 RepID=A0A1M4WJK5_9BACE|nr:ROK family protein [Bacteroides faecichinchillae]THG67842.1 ROK family protein [Bacteroides faecichinchillae]SHE81172.1 glucokinase [Bacteroides faecichinchillae]
MYEHDERIVMTLDAGGTNFVFSAMQGCHEIIDSICLPAVSDNLEHCLSVLVEGFLEVEKRLPKLPVAISFAFPGPADYEHGIIGDLPNFPAFRGGVALGPYLEEQFGIPVFINNDGNLFAYGEALSGTLPEINKLLKAEGSNKIYKNLLGITLGTGFGAGVVINNQLLTGDNGCGGDVWIMRNKKYPEMITEESVSIRAVRRVYQEVIGEDASSLTPKDIFDIAEGTKKGNQQAAINSFYELGEMAAHAIIQALNIVDGLVVIGGGIAGAAKYILPSMMKEMQRQIHTFTGASFPCLQMEVFNLTEEEGMKNFLKEKNTMVNIPFSKRQVIYANHKKVGIAVSSLGTNKAVALGAYTFALSQLET